MKLTIGSRGSFEFLPPFDLASNSTVFEVISISDIVEMEANNLLPFELIYKKVGLAKSVMYNDIQNNVKIVTLKSDKGYTYIPDTYVAGVSDVIRGVEYNRRTLMFKICALPAEEDLSSIITDVRALITARLGVVPIGEDIPTSKNTLIADAQHISFELERTALRSKRGNYQTIVAELESIIATKDEHIAQLECLLCNATP